MRAANVPIKLGFVSFVPDNPLNNTPTLFSGSTTSFTPSVRKLAEPNNALAPLAPLNVPFVKSTPAIKLGSIAAPNWALPPARPLPSDAVA